MNFYKKLKPFISLVCVISLILSMISVPVVAADTYSVTATTDATIKQGNSTYCYVYIDSTEDLAALDVSVHYDPAKVKITSVYNSVSCILYDSVTNTDNIQFSYLLDGKGSTTKTRLFYFRYQVLSGADVGNAYFDITIGEAYDSSLNDVSVFGSRCKFTIAETVTSKSCSVSGTSSMSTAINQEFTLNYSFSTYQIASGTAVITYDSELFEVIEVTQGAFLTEKVVDINADLTGEIYISFVGTKYYNNKNLVTVTFKTIKNVAETSKIVLKTPELLDTELNSISCSGYTTNVNVAFDETYVGDAPTMQLDGSFSYEGKQITLEVTLEAGSHLGAGDFVITFDPELVYYNSCTKGFSPSYFYVNEKNVDSGELKFHIISLSDIVTEETVLTLVFDVIPNCESVNPEFTLDGTGLTDSLTKSIMLNFVDTRVEFPALGHGIVNHDAKEATCLDIGWNAYETCSRCDYTTYVEIPSLGHDPIAHKSKEATCLDIGWNTYETCSRCDYTTYVEIPALGHDRVYHEAQVETCTGIGWETYETCSRCDYSTYVEIPALGHDRVYHESKNATCTDIGWDAYDTCSRCDYTTYVEIPALGHDIVNHESKDATCLDIGWNAYDTCSRCDYSTYVEISALGHDYVTHDSKEATCLEIGWDAYDTCSRCDYSTYVEITALGHELISHEARIETCTGIGWCEYDTCTRCVRYKSFLSLPVGFHDSFPFVHEELSGTLGVIVPLERDTGIIYISGLRVVRHVHYLEVGISVRTFVLCDFNTHHILRLSLTTAEEI